MKTTRKETLEKTLEDMNRYSRRKSKEYGNRRMERGKEISGSVLR